MRLAVIVKSDIAYYAFAVCIPGYGTYVKRLCFDFDIALAELVVGIGCYDAVRKADYFFI